MQTVMQNHRFANVPDVQIPRSRFERKSGHKTTLDAGYLVPIFVDEVLPGDSHKLNLHMFGRLATPLKPVMDNMFLDYFFFFVPSRLLWDNWERFNGAQDDPGDSTDFTVPVVTTPNGGYALGSIADYFALPIEIDGMPDVNALPFRAYNRIYNDWFRDQNLIDSAPVNRDDGPDADTDYVLRRRGKRHDYLTACLLTPQKAADILLPLGGTAPLILAAGAGPIAVNSDPNIPVNFEDSGATPYDVVSAGGVTAALSASGTTVAGTSVVTAELSAGNMNVTPSEIASELEADLTNASAASINAFRQAMQLQVFYELDNRGGTRYTEIIRAHFGVVSPDARLQRPEYLGGGSEQIHIQPIAQTTPNATPSANNTLGNLAGFGTVSHDGLCFVKSFTEHGYIIGIVSVRADLTYQRGIDRMWSRQTRVEFYQPALSRIGEQAVLNKEVFVMDQATNDPGTGLPYNDGVFGYQERYGEYRYMNSHITGLFRSEATGTIDIFHLAQDFTQAPFPGTTPPLLDQTFIEENPPVDRVIAVPSQPHIILDCFFDLVSARPMAVYSVPAGLERF